MYKIRSAFHLIVTIALYVSSNILAQKPLKVESFVKDYHTIPWYEEQASLWREVLDKNTNDENAWSNYYSAIRNIYVLRNKTVQDDSLLCKTLKKMSKSIPNTFTYNFYQGLKLGLMTPEGKKYLEKAYQVNPHNPLIFDHKVIQAELDDKPDLRREYNKQWFKTNDMSPGILAYNYNVLACLEPNAVLFTFGDNDTYPIWMIQDVLNFRNDVTILNINLLENSNYRSILLNRINLKLDTEAEKSISFTTEASPQEIEEKKKILIKIIADNLSNRPVYVGLTGSGPAVKHVEDKLYIIGLASLYSHKKIENTGTIRKNYEKNMLLDGLKATFSHDRSQIIVGWCQQNYLPSMIMLYHSYKASGEYEKAENIKSMALKIAQQGDKTDELLKQLTSSN